MARVILLLVALHAQWVTESSVGRYPVEDVVGMSGYSELPRADLTPGVTRSLTRATVCSTKWGLDRRHVTESMRKQVFAAYGIPYSEHANYELDHLIPRELGGADDVANLWPQRWYGPHGARQKDRLENALHRAVCGGQLSLHDAQEAIRKNWISAYRHLVRQ